MEHRVANSLQIIASILLLKAGRHLRGDPPPPAGRASARDVGRGGAAPPSRLDGIDQIEVGAYLTKLCDSLASSMIGEAQAIVNAMADRGRIHFDRAVSIGLIVTELVVNAIKYAFPTQKAGARILVTYEINGNDWKLTVSDNGVGKAGSDVLNAGLGTAIVEALVKQLDARIDITTGATGTTIAVTRGRHSPHGCRKQRKGRTGTFGNRAIGNGSQRANLTDCVSDSLTVSRAPALMVMTRPILPSG